MKDFNVKIDRLSDVFLPREPLASRRADRLRFEFDSTKSGRRMRDVTLHAVTVSNDAEILFECMCHETNSMKTFRFKRIASDIECGGEKYSPDTFLFDCLGLSEAQCREAVQTAFAYTHIRENFEKFVGEALADASPVWTGNTDLVLKFRGKKLDLALKSVFLLGEDDYYLWGYSNTRQGFLFVPFAAIEGKITADGKGHQKKMFLPRFLGLNAS